MVWAEKKQQVSCRCRQKEPRQKNEYSTHRPGWLLRWRACSCGARHGEDGPASANATDESRRVRPSRKSVSTPSTHVTLPSDKTPRALSSPSRRRRSQRSTIVPGTTKITARQRDLDEFGTRAGWRCRGSALSLGHFWRPMAVAAGGIVAVAVDWRFYFLWARAGAPRASTRVNNPQPFRIFMKG